MSNKIEWKDAHEPSEEEFKAFLKANKIKGLPVDYHKPEIFD